MRRVNNVDVVVMRGSYSYIGPDGLSYVVDWYADETGFHPSAAHLPKPVEIPFPEQKAAVEAQLRFAEESRAAQEPRNGRTLEEDNFVEDEQNFAPAEEAYETNFQNF